MRKKTSTMSQRLMRINDEIFKECANILRTELKDPRISSMVTVTKVDTTKDLSYAKIYVSIMGEDDKKKEVLDGLKNAAGFIRSRIAAAVNLRNTPELKFVLDDSLEYSLKMEKLISEAAKGAEE
ncbi:30S ribosome-binding factor RbfA [Tyzzerella sp. OttesenSCG-928-J15]|nr:30S ribosome-binding factor RbfA [Tyzzerella sp. OttesenSCG-928-J15]